MRQRYCKVCRGWHELDEPWPVKCLRAAETHSSGIHIIKDIEPYRSVAGDVANGGKPITVSGRRQHREFLQRNRYIEVGNDLQPHHREELSRDGRIADIKRAIGE